MQAKDTSEQMPLYMDDIVNQYKNSSFYITFHLFYCLDTICVFYCPDVCFKVVNFCFPYKMLFVLIQTYM